MFSQIGTHVVRNLGRQLAGQAVRSGIKYASNYLSPRKPAKKRPAKAKAPKKRTLPRRSVRALNNSFRKANQVKRLVGPTVNNVYTKKSSRIRSNGNKAKLSLQTRLQSGLSLPNTTFAKLTWRGSDILNTYCTNPYYTGPGITSTIQDNKTFVLNTITEPPSLNPDFSHMVTYTDLWRKLYAETCVFGSKAKFKITPTSLPSNSGNVDVPATTIPTTKPISNLAEFSNTLGQFVKSGYWYARVYYHRANGTTPVGHEITYGGVPLSAADLFDETKDCGAERWWANEREFLSDPTVTFKKDTSTIRQKLHIHTQTPIDSVGLANAKFPGEGSSTSYEIEVSNKPVYLTVNFSAKKNFEIKDALSGPIWTEWDQSLADSHRFYVRIGYIAFGSTDNIIFHVPISRNPNFTCEVDINYFVGLRKPLINPHTETPEAAGRMMKDVNMFEDEEEEFLDDEAEFQPLISDPDPKPDDE